MDVGRKILNLRLDRGLLQSELAELSGVTGAAICKIEKGMNAPRGAMLFRIAAVLGVPCD